MKVWNRLGLVVFGLISGAAFAVNGEATHVNAAPIAATWIIGGENAAFTIQGNTARMLTSYHGCTEIQNIILGQSADGRLTLTDDGPTQAIPAGCTGGSAPFAAANGMGIMMSTLEVLPQDGYTIFSWRYTDSSGQEHGPILLMGLLLNQ